MDETSKKLSKVWRSRYKMLQDWHDKNMPDDFILALTYKDLKRMISPEVTSHKFLKQVNSAHLRNRFRLSRLYPHQEPKSHTHIFVRVNPNMKSYVYNYYKQLEAEQVFVTVTPKE